MRHKKVLTGLAGVVAVGAAAALAAVGVSSAAGTQTDSIGEAGVVAAGTTYHSVSAVLTTTPLSQQWVPGIATNNNADAAGVQLCDNNTGNAAQIGLIRNTSNAASTFSVRFAVGALAGTTVDPCVGVGVLNHSSALASAALGSIPQGDQVALSIQTGHKTVTHTTYTWVYHWTHWYKHWYKVNGKWHYKWVWHWAKWYKVGHNSKVKYSTVQFQAQDLGPSSASTVAAWTSNLYYLPNGQVYYEVGAGAQRQASSLGFTNPLTHNVADFTKVEYNGTGVLAQGGAPVLFSLSNSTAVQSAAGVASEPQVAPGPLGDAIVGQGTDGHGLGSFGLPAVPTFPATIAQTLTTAGQFSIFTGPENS